MTPRLLGLVTAALAVLAACAQDTTVRLEVDGGDAERAPAIIQRHGCGTCHTITGVAGADGDVGPPLVDFASRRVIAGLLPNDPDNLVTWIRFPQAVDPGNVMPDLGLSEQEARDVAAYLYEHT